MTGETRDSNVPAFMVSTMLGMLTGIVIGLLFAPVSGCENKRAKK
jgi:gas vesicle protein